MFTDPFNNNTSGKKRKTDSSSYYSDKPPLENRIEQVERDIGDLIRDNKTLFSSTIPTIKNACKEDVSRLEQVIITSLLSTSNSFKAVGETIQTYASLKSFNTFERYTNSSIRKLDARINDMERYTNSSLRKLDAHMNDMESDLQRQITRLEEKEDGEVASGGGGGGGRGTTKDVPPPSLVEQVEKLQTQVNHQQQMINFAMSYINSLHQMMAAKNALKKKKHQSEDEVTEHYGNIQNDLQKAYFKFYGKENDGDKTT
jgi:hypothetical protein